MQRSRVVLGETGLPDIRSELDKTLPVTGLAMLGEDPQKFMFKFPGLLRNTEVLEKAAGGHGLLTINPERDGIVRRVPMIMEAQGTHHALAELRTAAAGDGTDTILIKTDEAGVISIGVKGLQLKIPTDIRPDLGSLARNDPSIYVSAVDMLDDRVAPK